jgi:hypothetical protein
MMKKVVFFVVSLLLMLSFDLYAADTLEKDYETQLESINTDIFINEQRMELAEDIKKRNKICSEYKDYEYYKNCQRHYDEAVRDYYKSKDRLEELTEERRVLKIKVMDRYKKLPTWWAEK